MQMSKISLLKEAQDKNYKPDILEKVYRLLDIFKQIISVEYLEQRLVLKGGTALNLFYFDHLPRLSVDIDLNYIGQLERKKMLEERKSVIEAIHKILLQNQFELYRSPMYHAGGKMVWFYDSALGQRSTLEIDINFMYRQPLYPVVYRKARIDNHDNWEAPVLDIHELAAGKLSALFNRRVSRDLFDAHYLMTKTTLNLKKLRDVFIPYLAMTKMDISTLTPENVEYNLTDLKNRLLPVMHQQGLPRKPPMLKLWAEKMMTELREALATILPINANETEFIRKIREEGTIQPELITNNSQLSARISTHPAILWAAKQLS